MTLPNRILIVEDEEITQRFLQYIFRQHNTEVVGCFDNAAEVLAQMRELECDMILMDINIKGPMDGIQLARKILERKALPIVFITAHDDEETVEETLELSPYGFICKPFTGRDVVVTVQIAYKRYLAHSKVLNDTQQGYQSKDLCINQTYQYLHETSQLLREGEVVSLTKNQAMLVKVLAENAGQTVSYDALVHAIWGEGSISDSALRTLVYSLRKLLPDLPIHSHSKLGYALETMGKR